MSSIFCSKEDGLSNETKNKETKTLRYSKAYFDFKKEVLDTLS